MIGEFPFTPLPTISVELKSKVINLPGIGDIKAQIWDTAGQEKYKSISTKYF